MPFTSRTRLVNPRLGQYFGIVVSIFVALALVVLVLEQLGVDDSLLRLAMLLGPLGLFVAIGLMAATRQSYEYFASGRRVPSIFNGIILSVQAAGGVGLLSITGVIFLFGYDGLCLAVGWMAGMVVAAILLVPFMRKYGGYTLPGYLGQRFASRPLRILSAVLLTVPILLLLQAELRIATFVAGWLYNPGRGLLTFGLLAVVVAALLLGGMRSLSWSSAAMALAALIAIIVPVCVVGAIETNLPLPQFSQGPMMRLLSRLEDVAGVPSSLAPAFAFTLPGDGLEPISKRFLAPGVVIGPIGFIIASFVIMAGIAASPMLLARAGTTVGVYDARKSFGWGVFILGAIFLTAAAVAAFMRFNVMEDVLTPGPDRLPDWFKALADAGLAGIDRGTPWSLASIRMKRDGVLLALPMASSFPAVVVYLILAGALAAALASVAASLTALAFIWSEDIVGGLLPETPSEPFRLLTARGAIVAAALIAGVYSAIAPGDALELTLWAFALLGSAFFPVLVLSIWWKRLEGVGAIVSVVTGFTVALMTILSGEAAWFGVHGALAGMIGIPAAVLVALLSAVGKASPRRSELELVRDIRIPGGETVYDREMRLLRLRRRREP